MVAIDAEVFDRKEGGGQVKPKRLHYTRRRRIQPFTSMIEEIWDRVREMETAELKSLYHACDECSSTNCGWTTHLTTNVLMPLIYDEVRSREAK
jgi:hypothetical protein